MAPSEHLKLVDPFVRERTPRAIAALGRVDDNAVRMKLGVEVPASVVGEPRDEEVPGGLFLRDSAFGGPRSCGFLLDKGERLGDRGLVCSDDAARAIDEREEGDALWCAECEIETRAALSIGTTDEHDPVGKASLERGFEDSSLHFALEPEHLRAFSPPG